MRCLRDYFLLGEIAVYGNLVGFGPKVEMQKVIAAVKKNECFANELPRDPFLEEVKPE